MRALDASCIVQYASIGHARHTFTRVVVCVSVCLSVAVKSVFFANLKAVTFITLKDRLFHTSFFAHHSLRLLKKKGRRKCTSSREKFKNADAAMIRHPNEKGQYNTYKTPPTAPVETE